MPNSAVFAFTAIAIPQKGRQIYRNLRCVYSAYTHLPRSFLPLHFSFSLLRLILFQNGDVNFLICTDVAARGIDITGLPYGENLLRLKEPDDCDLNLSAL